ncbi:MAG: MqnA/MqnD/SBP family protein [Nitrososphaeraceae archaeon]|jgi:1,4-dihydroxy-6-naphthoate synthase
MKQVTLGHTPDADDAFMFYGIASGNVNSPYFDIQHVIEDIEKLNKRAIDHELDITAISAHAYAYIKDYVILNSGGSFGINYGPIVISKKNIELEQLHKYKIGIPGKMTSANLLLKLAIGKFDGVEIIFSEIPKYVSSGLVDAGLIIHEGQISFGDEFQKILDLGRWWHDFTNGMPVPLGINVISKRSLTTQEIIEFDKLFKSSIEYGLQHLDDALEYSMQFSRGNSKLLIEKFVKMYVNDLTINMNHEGKNSIITMLRKAKISSILSYDELLFVDSNNQKVDRVV